MVAFLQVDSTLKCTEDETLRRASSLLRTIVHDSCAAALEQVRKIASLSYASLCCVCHNIFAAAHDCCSSECERLRERLPLRLIRRKSMIDWRKLNVLEVWLAV